MPTPLQPPSGTNPRDTLLAPNFSLREFVRDVDPIPAPAVLDNLYRIANRLQTLRDLLGKPIFIHSGYRTPDHNRDVGGAPKSLHLEGKAVDIHVPDMSPQELYTLLRNWSGGMGLYKYHLHLDIRNTNARWQRL